MHLCHVAVCLWDHISSEVPRASVEAPWTPASLVPGSNPTARAARTGSSSVQPLHPCPPEHAQIFFLIK